MSLLSPRQREVVHLKSCGLSRKEIGNRLGISEGAVKAHLRESRLKIGNDAFRIAVYRNGEQAHPMERTYD